MLRLPQKSLLKTLIFKVGSLSILILPCFIFALSTSATDALRLTISSSTLELNLMPLSSDGVFSSSDNLDISVTMNVMGGYTLGIKGDSSSSNPTALVNTTDNSKYFSSISTSVSPANYKDNTYALANNLNNTWGYLPSKYNSNLNTNYQPAPSSTTGDILDTVSNFSGTNNYTISFGARANNTTTIGTYEGTFIITAVPTITCNANATTIGDAICMQDMNDSVATSMVEGTQYQLLDIRDNKLYYIAKMKDGRVWMTQNLDLDLISDTTADNYVELNHTNTDLGWTTNDTTATWVPASTTSTNAADWGTNNNTAPASYDPGDAYYYYDKTADITTAYNNTTATADCNAAHSDGTCDHYHVGNYYNWSAAVAMNDTSSITDNYTSANNSICPAGWRLPAGRTSTTSGNPGYYSEINYTWVSEGLATTYQANNFGATWGADGFKNIRSSNMYMVAAGYKSDESSIIHTPPRGFYWTSTNTTSTMAYASYYYNDNLHPAYSNSTNTIKGRGMSVRCAARQSNTGSTIITFDANESTTTTGSSTGSTASATITSNTWGTLTTNGYSISGYFFTGWNTESDGSGTSYANTAQYYAKVGTEITNVTLYAIWERIIDMTTVTTSGNIPNNCTDNTPVRNLRLVYDPRDNETYWIAELCDGKIWMLDNLRLDLTKALPSYSGSDKITLTTSNTNASGQAISCLTTGSYNGVACTGPYATSAVIQSTSWGTTGTAYTQAKINKDYSEDIAPVTYGQGDGKVGIYYNYCAVSAGSYCYAQNAGVDITNSWRDIESDICPAGWRLPTGNTNSDDNTRITDYGTLYAAYNSDATIVRNTLSTPLSGYFVNNSQNTLGARGYLWSSTYSDTNFMFTLSVYPSDVYPSGTNYRHYGFSVRCVLGS